MSCYKPAVCVKVSSSHIQASDVCAFMRELLIDERLHESFNTVFQEAQAERIASVKASTLSYEASGLVGYVLTIWVTSQWNIFSLRKKRKKKKLKV